MVGASPQERTGSMSFCANCGRPHDKDARFCSGCGTGLNGPAGDGPATEETGQAGPTRLDLPAESPRSGTVGGRPDSFESWYQPQTPAVPPGGLRDGSGEEWQPTQTVNAGPPAGYPPAPAPPAQSYQPAQPYPPAQPYEQAPPFPPGQYFPPGQHLPPGQPPGGPERGGHRGLFITLALLVVLAAGGGAYALAASLGSQPAAQPPASPTVSGPGASASSQPSGAQASTTAPTQSATATPSPGLSLVAIAPGVSASSASSTAVETLLSHYFHGINSHNYAEYASTLNPAQQARQSQSTFNSGFSSTADSGMTLTSLASSGSGLTATVTFTSHQAAAQSVDHSTCNDWTLNFYLVPQGTGYLIGPAPSGYQPDHSDC
jgi:hypothetical protein